MSGIKEWECGECGATLRRAAAPPRCPRCGAPKSAFEIVEDEEDMEEEYGAECPECGDWIPLPESISLGRRVRCQGCGGVFRLTELDPPVLEDGFLDEEED